MNVQDARQWLEKHITFGFVDSRELTHSAREVVTYHREHPQERRILLRALEDVVTKYQGTSPEQFETAAYLTVNLKSVATLRALVTAAKRSEGPEGEFITIAIAAIRSFPGDESLREEFFPTLLQWLKIESVAHRAFEVLCEWMPKEASAYLSLVAHYHREKAEIVQKALYHVYYHDGNTDQGASMVKSAMDAWSALSDVIETHPLLPEEFRIGIREKFRKSLARGVAAAPGHIPLPPEKKRQCDRAQGIIAKQGNVWGGLAL